MAFERYTSEAHKTREENDLAFGKHDIHGDPVCFEMTKDDKLW